MESMDPSAAEAPTPERPQGAGTELELPVQREGVKVGCAGWSVPNAGRHLFASEGSHLARYASALDAVEINSSFYRAHQPKTYARWAASVPATFRFAVKVPRVITHEHGLVDCADLLDVFLEQVTALGDKLGPLLVQLPASVEYDVAVVSEFFLALRARFRGDVVCEPRHVSWASEDASSLLADLYVSRVAADPPRAGCGRPDGWGGLAYYRLHGSPHLYASSYDDARLAAIEAAVTARRATSRVWCIFDNTAVGAAAQNAVDLRRRLAR